MADKLAGSAARTSMTARDSELLAAITNTKSFSQNPRWKRHASIDGGATFRSRIGSLVYAHSPTDADSPIDYEDEDEKRFLSDLPSGGRRPSDFPFIPPSRRGSFMPTASNRSSFSRASFANGESPTPAEFLQALPKRWAAGMFLTMTAGAIFLVMGGLYYAIRQPAEAKLWGVKGLLENVGVALPHVVRKCENPYREYGHLKVDHEVPENNRWLPYDPSCAPPALLATLRTSRPDTIPPLTLPVRPQIFQPKTNLPLPWLQGKTVLLFGDHVERFHAKDFCTLSGGAFEVIGPEHPLSPPRFVNGIDEKFMAPGGANGFNESRPTVCYLERYDFMIVTAFHYGLANRVEFEKETLWNDPHFYPPVAIQDRLSSIVLPLLASLGRYPNLIEFSSGFWDLRHFTALDERTGQSSNSQLTLDRLEWYSERLTAGLERVGDLFPTTPLLWRALHHPPSDTDKGGKSIPTTSTRVAELDQLSRKVINNLNRRHSGLSAVPHLVTDDTDFHRPPPEAVKDRESTHTPFLNRVKERIGKTGGQQSLSSTLGKGSGGEGLGHVRIDEWGALMMGQQHLMDGLHTPMLPGGYLWSDMMLFELRRVVYHSR